MAAKRVKATRKLSAYNKFMKTELAKLKRQHPNVDHRDRFSMAAANWSGSGAPKKRVAKKTTGSAKRNGSAKMNVRAVRRSVK